MTHRNYEVRLPRYCPDSWTHTQQTMLETYYGVLTNEDLAGLIGRSVVAVERRAEHLGIRKTENRQRFSQELLEYLSGSGEEEAA